MTIQSLPADVLAHCVFERLDQRALSSAALTCKQWKGWIDQETFFRRYAASRSVDDLRNFTPTFFAKIVPHLQPFQVFYLDERKISRHYLQTLSETEQNRTNLRIAKLIASIGWYQEHIQTVSEACIHQWHSENAITAQQFRESLDYVHLYLLGTSLEFLHDRADQEDRVKQINESLGDGFELSSKEDLNQLIWYQASSKISTLVCIDYCLLKGYDPTQIDPLLAEQFKRVTVKHLFDPRGDGDFSLTNVFFKALFSSLQAEHLNPQLFPLIKVDNDEKLTLLGQWLKDSQAEIDKLKVFFPLGGLTITLDCLKAFGETLKWCRVKEVVFVNVDNARWELCEQIRNETMAL